eukprot:scaffold415_cov124-Isochrysis_galbana.AAC.9
MARIRPHAARAYDLTAYFSYLHSAHAIALGVDPCLHSSPFVEQVQAPAAAATYTVQADDAEAQRVRSACRQRPSRSYDCSGYAPRHHAARQMLFHHVPPAAA